MKIGENDARTDIEGNYIVLCEMIPYVFTVKFLIKEKGNKM